MRRDALRGSAMALDAHALSLGAVPVAGYAASAVPRGLAEAGPFAGLALASDAVSGVATLIASTTSGPLVSGLIARVASAEGEPRRAAAAPVLDSNRRRHQAFAKLVVAASSPSIGLWSIEIGRGCLMRRGSEVLRCIAALGAVLADGLRLDAHGFGAVVLAQSA